MTRQVPNDAPLSTEDRTYLHARGEHARVEQIDAMFPPGSEQAPEADPVEVDAYDEWAYEDLKEECRDRKLPVSGKKEDLVVRLRADDASRS